MVKVKDVIQYLQRFNPEAEVYLDHDGWMEDETGIENPSVLDIIRCRGLFVSFKDTVLINN